MEWMILPLKRYAEFSGRSQRKEYWMFFLFTIIVSFVLGIVDAILGLKIGGTEAAGALRSGNGVLGTLFSLGTLVPSLAVGVRRLHDTDRSGWWLLLPGVVIIVALVLVGLLGGFSGDFTRLGIGLIAAVVVAAISGIVLLVFFCLDGTRGPNRFGPDPKGGDLADVFA